MSSASRKRQRQNGRRPVPRNMPRWGWLVLPIVVCLLFAGSSHFGWPWRVRPSPSEHSSGRSDHRDALAGADQQWVSAPLLATRVQDHEKALDPARDGWNTEVISGQIQQQMDRLGKALQGTATQGPDLSADFACRSLRPPHLERAFHAPPVTVWRATGADTNAAAPTFTDLMQACTESITGKVIHWASKIIEIRLVENEARTVHFVESVSHADQQVPGQQVMEHHRTWKCVWELTGTGTPRLRSLEVEGYEETHRATIEPWFVDASQALLANSAAYRDQLAWGLNHWLDRIETVHGMYAFAEYGIALGDADGDDREDVYVCQPGGLPNRLLLRQPDGTLRDAPPTSGVNWLDHTSSALFLDLDNDSDQDLVVALESREVLCLQNDGHGTFVVSARLPLEDRHVQTLCAADYDLDGDVDIYLTVGHADQRARDGERRPEFVYHDANDGGANVLFRNDIAAPSWQFTNVTREVGLDVNNRRHSLAAAWCDYDQDGDSDLYVANDYGQNCLYRNDAGHFVEIAQPMGVVDFGSGMSVSWGDFNQDGSFDLYVGNMFSTAGRRIATQAQFRPHTPDATRDMLARFAKGNTLFVNEGGQRFREVSAEAGVEMGRWAWSSPFVDLNNDGAEDLFVANGYITSDLPDDL